MDLRALGLDLRLGGLNPAGGSEGGDGKIRVEGARAKAEGIGAGSDGALTKAVEGFHAIGEGQTIQLGNAQEFAIADGGLFVGDQERGLSG